MKLLQIFRFELTYQARRLTTPLFFLAIGTVAFMFVRGNFLEDALHDDFFINAPYVISFTSVFGCLFWLLIAGALAGEIAARDVETGMHPLSYTAPVSKVAYLGGRFLAAFVLNALILLAIPIGILLSVYGPGVDAGVIGPFRSDAFLYSYGLLILPNAFIGTAIQFAWAALSRKALASYIGSVLLFCIIYGGVFLVFYFGASKELAMLLDVIGQLTAFEITTGWTSMEKNTRLLGLRGPLLHSRILWTCIAIASLSFTYFRFRFVHPAAKPWWGRLSRSKSRKGLIIDIPERRSLIALPKAKQDFGMAGFVTQTFVIARASFRTVALSRGGLVLMPVVAALVVLIVPEHMRNLGSPLLPKTAHLLQFLGAPLTELLTPWLILPLLIILYAGEIVWREREAGLGEITDAAPVPDVTLLLGRFLGLGLMILAWMVLLILAGMLVQLRMGYYEFEIGLYLQILIGLRLPEYLLFGFLALALQGLMGHKYLGHLIVVLVYAFMLFASWIGLKHHLLVFGSGPAWAYSEIRGFGASFAPWIWLRLYWLAWALVLVVAARLFWIRGVENGLRPRLLQARSRVNRNTAWAAGAALGIVLLLGGFIFYNTNICNEYTSPAKWTELRAQYEQRYGRFRDAPQPELAEARLEVALFPKKREAIIRGSYCFVNRSSTAIDSIHLAIVKRVLTDSLHFDRPAKLLIRDEAHGHLSYLLDEPLKPGDTLGLSFRVRVRPNGFRNEGADAAIVANGSYFKSDDWLPAIGYQQGRELMHAAERRAQGLAPRPLVGKLEDVAPSEDETGEGAHDRDDGAGMAVEAILSTDEGQVAIGPGALLRTWTDRPATGEARDYFHYRTDAPIGNGYAFFSANYALHQDQWTNGDGSGQVVAIQIYHHPGHSRNVDRLLRSVRACLDNYSREFGPYPFGYLRLVENPVRNLGAHADAGSIDYGHGFSLFNTGDGPDALDFPFAVIAHEVAHQWWGVQLPYAPVEGLGLLTESPAWYSAMGVVEETYGREHLQRLMRFFRQPFPITPIRQSVPLLRGKDPYALYRKGPFALFALSEYMGKDRVNGAYRRLIERHKAGSLPMATSLDLYQELQAATPDSLQYLLRDLFAENTLWQLATESATAVRNADSTWRLTLRLQARKLTVDPAGREEDVPMNEWIPIGAFAPTGEGRDFGKTLYLRKHRIRSGTQTIVLNLPSKPADAGIDPHHLLIDLEPFDNVERVNLKK